MFKNNVSSEMEQSTLERVYSNQGNVPLMKLLSGSCERILDIGCGAGDNARLIKSINPKCNLFGITHSESEAALAQVHMVKCWAVDIEKEFPDDLADQTFDAIIFAHVLEHLRNPVEVLNRASRMLRKGGQILIAVPNVLFWRMRIQFLRGDFQYQSSGVLDDTHLHFYTYCTAHQSLLANSPDLKTLVNGVSGNVPLWLLRRHILPRLWSKYIDELGCRYWPNLFGDQVLISAVKQ
jgi:2-polyprenyl-3-methyl-5-hydroxy-6-metoxy-1,4-benzoquinol methylase